MLQTMVLTPEYSDSAVKQILITMNERETPGFIVEDLDDFHLLIKPEHEHRIRRELETEVRAVVVTVDEPVTKCWRSWRRIHIASRVPKNSEPCSPDVFVEVRQSTSLRVRPICQ